MILDFNKTYGEDFNLCEHKTILKIGFKKGKKHDIENSRYIQCYTCKIEVQLKDFNIYRIILYKGKDTKSFSGFLCFIKKDIVHYYFGGKTISTKHKTLYYDVEKDYDKFASKHQQIKMFL